MACVPNAGKSRSFAAGVCRFPEFTIWALLVFSIDVDHSAAKRPLLLLPILVWSQSSTCFPCAALGGPIWFILASTCADDPRACVRNWCQVALMMQLCLFPPETHTHIHALGFFHLVWASLSYLWHDRPHSTDVCWHHDIGRESWEWVGQESIVWQAPTPPKWGSIPHEGKRGDAWIKWLLLLNVIVS